MWQDTAIATGQLVLAGSLVPIIRSKTEKPPLSTSLLNMTIVSFLTVVMGTLRLWIAMVTAALIAGLWAVVFVQKLRATRSPGVPLLPEVDPQDPGLELVGADPG